MSGSPARVELASSKLARAQPTAPDNDLRAAATATNAFAVDLYRRWKKKKNPNLVFSPYSISFALAMTLAGARGETAEELRRALHLALADDRLHDAVNALDQEVTHPTSPPPGTNPLAIAVANSL